MPSLFESTEINSLIMANRFVRSATWDGLATQDGQVTPRMTDLLVRLAEGGSGLIVTGHAFVHSNGKHSDWQLGIHEDRLVSGLRAMTDAVHEKTGRVAVQLGYGGSYLSRSRVERMTVQDLREVAQSFGRAAERAVRAGFDGVQILAAHGFFLSQLLCPRYNKRTDDYGRDLPGRSRLLLEVLEAVRRAVGRDYPVLVKLNASDFVEDGLTFEEALRVGAMLEAGGIDAIELSGGLLNVPGQVEKKIGNEEDEAFFKDEAAAFKEKVKVPLILVGGIRSFQVAEQLIGEGIADYISLCRPLIREPDLIKRWQAGDRRPALCISCNNCYEPVKKGEGLACVPLDDVEVETFFPHESVSVPAGPPHPPETDYIISFGLEEIRGAYIPVIKIQMAYKGKMTGKAPLFPVGSDDHQRVNRAIEELLSESSIVSE